MVLEEDSTALAADVVGDEDGDGAITAADALAKTGDAQRLALRSSARALLIGEAGTARAYLHTDHNGSVLAVTDDEGEVTERFAYYPWGAVRESTAMTSRPSRSGE